MTEHLNAHFFKPLNISQQNFNHKSLSFHGLSVSFVRLGLVPMIFPPQFVQLGLLVLWKFVCQFVQLRAASGIIPTFFKSSLGKLLKVKETKWSQEWAPGSWHLTSWFEREGMEPLLVTRAYFKFDSNVDPYFTCTRCYIKIIMRASVIYFEKAMCLTKTNQTSEFCNYHHNPFTMCNRSKTSEAKIPISKS